MKNHWEGLICCQAHGCNTVTYDYEDTGYGPVCQDCASENCVRCLLYESSFETNDGEYLCQDCYESMCCAAHDYYKDLMYD